MKGLLAAGLTAALCVAVAAQNFLPALKPGFLPLVLLALTGLAASGAGRRAVVAFGVDFDELEMTVAGATLGLGLLTLGTFALAVLGCLESWAASALLGTMLVIGWGEARSILSALREGAHRAIDRPWLCALIAIPLVLGLWACLVPPHQYDSLVYHLALPQAYLRAGKLYAPGGVVFAHFPQNGEMLFTLALDLGSDLLAQMYVWLATALTIAWLLTFGRRITSAAPWAAVLVATHTAIMLMSSTTYVEPLVMLWMTGALLAFEVCDEGRNRGPLILSAVFMGLALGTKYYAGLLAVFLAVRLAWRGGLKAALIFSGIASAIFAPWLVKNWIFVGNPVFPFLYQWFPATKIGWTSDLASGYFSVLTEYGHAHGFFQDLVRLPVLLFHNPLRFGGGMDVLGDLGWDLTLWLWAYGLWAARADRRRWGLAAMTILYFAGWFATGVVLRFLTGLAPAMALLGAAGAADWREKAGRAARGVAAAAAGVVLSAHFFLFFFVHDVVGMPSALLGLESRFDFLSRRLDYYPCAAYAGRALSSQANILVVGEQRGYYIPRAYLPTTVHAPNLYVMRANESDSPESLALALRHDGFTHLLFVPREAVRLGVGTGVFTARGEANWKGLENHLKIVDQEPACLLAALEQP